MTKAEEAAERIFNQKIQKMLDEAKMNLATCNARIRDKGKSWNNPKIAQEAQHVADINKAIIVICDRMLEFDEEPI